MELAPKVRMSFQRFSIGRYRALYSLKRNSAGFGQTNKPITVRTSGRVEYATDGIRWRGEYFGHNFRFGSKKTTPYNWVAGYDGATHFALRQPQNVQVFGEHQAHSIGIQSLFWSSHGKGLADSLANQKWTMTDDKTVQGRRCYSLFVERSFNANTWRYELVLAPRHSYLPVSYKVFYKGKLNWSHELLDLQESETGLWYPRKIKYTLSHVSTRVTVIRKFESRPKFGKDFFAPTIPTGAAVVDYRSGEVYRNDPWAAEIRPIMFREFNWPRPSVTNLASLATRSINKAAEGQAAPPLDVERWLQGKPIQLKQRRGKVTLLYLSPISLWMPFPKYTSSLKAIYKVYQPLGLEIVQVTGHSTELARLKQNLREMRIPWPVAVDKKAVKLSTGRTFEAFKAQHYHTPLLVDHMGKMRLVQQGKIADQIRDMLAAAGAKSVPTISLKLNQNRAPRKMYDFIAKRWRDAVKKEPNNAEITGVVSGPAGPLLGAEVTASLIFEFSQHPSGTTYIPYSRKPFGAVSGANGVFDIKGLTKGTYLLTIKSPGHATVNRKLSIANSKATKMLKLKLKVL